MSSALTPPRQDGTPDRWQPEEDEKAADRGKVGGQYVQAMKPHRKDLNGDALRRWLDGGLMIKWHWKMELGRSATRSGSNS
jgi:hypothetical protein